MSEKEIILYLSKWIDDREYPFQFANAFIYGWECDYWAMTTSGKTREFEIKISRSDFKNDAKKSKHGSLDGANFFYYVCPEGLIKKDEIDKNYGLIYIKNEYPYLEKRPRMLHDKKFDRWESIATKIYWRYRALWREKYIQEQITVEEFLKGSYIDLEGEVL